MEQDTKAALISLQPSLNPSDRDTLFRAVSYIVILLSMVGVLLKWMNLGADHPPLPGMLVVTACIANSVYYSRTGNLNISSSLVVAILFVGLVISGYSSGGFAGPIVILAPIIPILALMLMGQRAGWVSFAGVTICLVGFFFAHLNDLIPPNPNGPTGVLVGRTLAVIFSALFATWIIWAFTNTVGGLLTENETLANQDHLTGIANRRAIERCLDNEIARARRSRVWLSFIMTDVDFFKRYNDTNGHQAGDECLIRIANILQQCAQRPADLVGRFGGEEFVIVLPDTDPEGAIKVAEHIRQATIDEQIFYDDETKDVVTLTLGAVSFQGQLIPSAEGLLKPADDLLYKGKKLGRNRVLHRVFDGKEQP